MSNKKRVFEFEGTLPLADAIRHLENLLGGLKEGTIRLSRGADAISLTPAKVLEVEIEAKQKDDKESLSVAFKWQAQSAAPTIEALQIASDSSPKTRPPEAS